MNTRVLSVVHVDRAGDDDGALGKQEPVALVLGDREMVGDDVELLARHLEHRAGIEALHAAVSLGAAQPLTIRFDPSGRTLSLE